MKQQTQFSEPRRFQSPLVLQTPAPKKVNVYFTYQSSPLQSLKQSLKTIKEQQQEKKKHRIFQTRRKLSFKSKQSVNRRTSRLKIFDQPRKRIQTMKSHIFLKDSVISNSDTIVDQLEELQFSGDKQTLTNPINKKLQNIRNKQPTKRTFYSNTAKNSIILNDNLFFPRRNRIESQVLSYQYSPNPKNRSAVTIKASKDTKNFGVSKFSNGISINTNYQNKQIFQQLSNNFGNQNAQTPKYHHRSSNKYRQSFQPALSMKQIDKKQMGKKESQRKSIEGNHRKNSCRVIDLHNNIDRFYDESSLQTPRLQIVNKKISYEVTDPLTNSLRKQKLQKQRSKQLEEQKLSKIKQESAKKIKQFFSILINYFSNFKNSTQTKLNETKQKCLSFTRSETFFIIIIVLLSLAIFMIQLFQ